MANKSGIKIKKSKQGSLHSALHVPQGKKIPASKLKIKSTDSPALKKKKQFGINEKHFKHQTGGPSSAIPDNIMTGIDPDLANWQSFGDHQDPYGPGPQNIQQGTPQAGPGAAFMPKPMSVTKGIRRNGTMPSGMQQFNGVASAVTGIGNIIQNQNLKKQEQLQMLQNITPKYMPNMEAQGLNNNMPYMQ